VSNSLGATITLTDGPTILAIANALRNGATYASGFSFNQSDLEQQSAQHE
jgi:hypothetical protein